MTNKTLNLAAIRLDGNTQSRVSINQDAVAEYANVITEGDALPAITVFFDGADYWLADGFHRLHAHLAAKKASIVADVLTGTCRDAILYSLAANTVHGLRPTGEDKRKAVGIMLADAEWCLLVDREIAKHCGCSHTLVSQIRRPKPEAAKPAAKPGKTDDSGNIAKNAPDQEPENSGNIAKTDAPAQETAPAKVDVYTPLEAAHDQIQDLQAELVVARINSTDSEEAGQAKALIADLRANIKTLEATLKAVKTSRDGYQNQVADLQHQINRQRREIDKLTGKRTA